MSKADKLFEELGYEKSIWKNCVGYVKREEAECILFLEKMGEPKGICINKADTEYPAMSISELKAINKKCEELGWL